MIGQHIGKYRVLDRIGKGGMGTVYRAMDEMLHRDVAIKVLNAELNDPEVAKRFRAEAITVARLSHPGIATIYELFEHEGQWLMVMEFVRGETLENMVTRMGPLSAQRSAELSMQALAALAHAHSMGVVHRDLKPANLMITENGSVKVMDFGIARVSGSEHLTNAGFMMGTPAYMAPEQVRGGEVDARADLYAMGVVFYRLTTAKLPFKGETAFAMVQSQVNEPPTPIGLVRSDLPSWVEEIVTRALAKAPEQRFQSAAEFHEALARCMAGLPISSMYAAGETMMTPARAMPSGSFPSRPTPSASFPIPGSSSGAQPVATPYGTNPAATPYGTNPPATPYGTNPAMAADSSALTVASPSGANMVPPPVAQNSPAVAAAPAAPSAAAPKVVKKTIPVMWIGVAAAVVIGGVVTVIMMSGKGAPPPTPTPAATTEPLPTPSPAGGDALSTAPPVATGAAPVGPPPAVQTPPAASTSAASASGSLAPTPAGRAGATPVTPGRGTPTPTVTAVPTPTPTPATGAMDLLATFSNVKVYEVTGKKGVDRDAVLNFVGGQLTITSKADGATLAALSYKRFAHATYIRAQDPKWDPKFASPPEGFDPTSGLVGLLKKAARHWLVLQGTDHFEVLRLEDSNYKQILETFEARTGIKIDRPKSP